MWAQTPVPTRPSNWVSSATMAGPMTPAIPLRVATENRIARLVKDSAGSTVSNQLAVRRTRQRPGLSNCPPRPTSGCPPTSSSPAATLDTAVRASRPSEKVIAASTLPANSCSRVHDRVSTVFQVPYRSSEENMSPASTPATSGKPQLPAKPRTTRATAKPEPWTQIPNSASAGVPLCAPSTAANASGPSPHSRASSRVESCAASLRCSAR